MSSKDRTKRAMAYAGETFPKGLSIVLSFGRWGGVYVQRGATWRVCLGWVAFTILFNDWDDIALLGLETYLANRKEKNDE